MNELKYAKESIKKLTTWAQKLDKIIDMVNLVMTRRDQDMPMKIVDLVAKVLLLSLQQKRLL